jgi:hypothetical protein
MTDCVPTRISRNGRAQYAIEGLRLRVGANFRPKMQVVLGFIGFLENARCGRFYWVSCVKMLIFRIGGSELKRKRRGQAMSAYTTP